MKAGRSSGILNLLVGLHEVLSSLLRWQSRTAALFGTEKLGVGLLD